MKERKELLEMLMAIRGVSGDDMKVRLNFTPAELDIIIDALKGDK